MGYLLWDTFFGSDRALFQLVGSSSSLLTALVVLVKKIGARLYPLTDADQRTDGFVKPPYAAEDRGRSGFPFPHPCVHVVDTQSVERRAPHIDVIRDHD